MKLKIIVYLYIFTSIFIPTVSAWSSFVNISQTVGSSHVPDLEIPSSGNLYVVWADDFVGPSATTNIFFSRSSDAGATWTTPLNVSNNSRGSDYPDLEIDSNGNLYLIWHEGESYSQIDIMYSNSSDNGATWTTPINVSNNSGYSSVPDLEISSDGNLFLTWSDNTSGNYEIYYSNSSNAGAMWSSFVNISELPQVSSSSDLEIDSNANLYVVWSDNTTTQYEIYYSNSSNAGSTWSTRVNISKDSQSSYNPDLEIDSSGNLYIAWRTRFSTSQFDILFANSSDNGATWTTPINVSNNSGISGDPSLEIDSNAVLHLIWDDDTASSYYELYYVNSSNRGFTWSIPEQITANSGNSMLEDAKLDSNNILHVVWSDEYPGNEEIYFSKSVLPGITGRTTVVTDEFSFISIIVLFIFAFIFFVLRVEGVFK